MKTKTQTNPKRISDRMLPNSGDPVFYRKQVVAGCAIRTKVCDCAPVFYKKQVVTGCWQHDLVFYRQ